jgi:hypothetical protein
MLSVKNSLIKKTSLLLVLLFVVSSSNLFAGNDQKLNSKWLANYNLIWTSYFADDLAVGESKTKTIYANKLYNWTSVKLIEGQTYKFSVGSPEWNNGVRQTTAEGYSDDANPLSLSPNYKRRFPSYNWMALVGSLYTYQDKYSYTGKSFVIGMGRTWKATKTGFVAAFANDCEGCYDDNSRVVTLTIKRVE